MKRMMTLVGLSVAMVLSASTTTEAQSKKKGKEPELVISKRGKLIFEDDFSGKEVLWEFDPGKCKWEIVKKALVIKSFPPGVAAIGITRNFATTKGIVVEMKMLLPPNCSGVIGVVRGTAGMWGYVRGGDGKSSGRMKLRGIFGANTEGTDAATAYFPYRERQWIEVVLEIVGQRYALTANGKCITFDCPPPDLADFTRLAIRPEGDTKEPFAIDDVKVYEALPKDEGEEKDEKGKKKK